LFFGEFDGRPSERCATLETALHSAGVEPKQVPDIQARIWGKFIVLSALSAATAITRLPLGPIIADQRARTIFEGAIEETAAVAAAHCPSLPEGAAGRARARGDVSTAHARVNARRPRARQAHGA
ncbi:MAG: ketopantoate reductase C-terminal domain-containing protein, partial [Pseudomonadota bacterium]